MTETFIRFLLFICIVLLFAVVSVLAQKFPIIRAFLSLLRKLLIFLLLILLGGFLIFAHSFLACIIIGLAAFFVPESHYLYAGEPINPLLDEHHTALFKLSVTYGILYLLVYISCILFYSLFRLSDWIHNGLIFITTSFIVVISYPVLIHAIFPDLTVSIKGALFLVIQIFLFNRKKSMRDETDTDDSRPVTNILYRLIPWIKAKTVKKTNKKNQPSSF